MEFSSVLTIKFCALSIRTKFRFPAGPKLNGTVKIPGQVFKNLGIRWALSIQQKSPVQIFGTFAGRMERFEVTCSAT